MEHEEPTIHPSGEHVPVRDRLEVLPARHALRVVGEDERVFADPDTAPSLPDLSVAPETKRPLLRSCWAAVVEIGFRRPDPRRHPGLYSYIGTSLKNRSAVIGVSSVELRIDFQVESGGAETHAMVREFAEQLRDVIGPEVDYLDYRINDLDPVQVDAILRKDRPDLRAL